MNAPGLKITNFHYSHMTFDQGPGTEYPKWVHMSGYESVIAANAAEEAKLLARPAKSGDISVEMQAASAQATAQEPVPPRKTLTLNNPGNINPHTSFNK